MNDKLNIYNLYLESASTNTPKFKIGDRVQTNTRSGMRELIIGTVKKINQYPRSRGSSVMQYYYVIEVSYPKRGPLERIFAGYELKRSKISEQSVKKIIDLTDI